MKTLNGALLLLHIAILNSWGTNYSLFEFGEEIHAGTVNLMNIYARGAHKPHQGTDSCCLAKLIQHQTAL